MVAAPGEEIGIVRLALEIGAGAIGEMRLAGALYRVVAGIDPDHPGDRTELADGRVDHLAVFDDVGVVIEGRVDERRAFADFGVAPQSAVADIGGRMDERRRTELGCH